MRWSAIVLGGLLACATGCAGGGEGCTLGSQHIPIGYCGTVECNSCRCEPTGELNCTVIGCFSTDPCWRTGAYEHLCSREPIFEPCDRELTPEEDCLRLHAGCWELPSGECGFVEGDGELAECLATAGDSG